MRASSMVSSDETNYKHFVGYKVDYYKVKSLQIMLLKTSAFVKDCDGEAKQIYFLNEDDNLLLKCIDIWKKCQ